MWAELCRDSTYRGRWVALEAVRYESGTAVEGEVVDSDEDLAELCARIQGTDYMACAILYCDEKATRRLSVS
jgi:hypothetical protein